MIGCNATL